MGYSSLHDAVMDASVSHGMTQMSSSDMEAPSANFQAATGQPVKQPKNEPADDGYAQLRAAIDEQIAALMETKEVVIQAEATNDPALLKEASGQLTTSLASSSEYWAVQVRTTQHSINTTRLKV